LSQLDYGLIVRRMLRPQLILLKNVAHLPSIAQIIRYKDRLTKINLI